MLAYLQDQPERRDYHHMRHGGGTYSARFRVSADHNALYPKLKACARCIQTLKGRIRESVFDLPLPTCTECLNWDALTASDLSLTRLPDAYPRLDDNEVTNSYRQSPVCRIVQKGTDQFLKPFAVTHESLSKATQLAHDQYIEGAWSMLQCKAYLQVECLSDSFIQLFKDNAESCLTLKIANDAIELYPNVIKDAKKNRMCILE